MNIDSVPRNIGDNLEFSLSFLAVVYNQKDYILDALNSILYQARNFFKNWAIQLVIADDASDDGTSEIIDKWLKDNGDNFKQVKHIRNDVNRGVCSNITNGIEALEGKYTKMIAGDDIFPVTSIRPIIEELENADIVMGIPIYFNADQKSGELLEKHYDREILHTIARVLFEKNKSFKRRIDRSSFAHTSSLAYRTNLLKNKSVISFIREFKYMEDYSMLYKIASINPLVRFKFKPQIAILYRRTSGSIIIHSYEGLVHDKVKLAKIILHDKDASLLAKIVKAEEIMIYGVRNKWIHSHAMPDYYVRKLGLYWNIRKAYKIVVNLKNDIHTNKHYIESLYE